MTDADTSLHLREFVDLGPLHREPDATAEHQVVEQELKIFDLLNVDEVTVVERRGVELLDEWGAQLPERTPRVRAAQVEHVVEQGFGFLLGVGDTDLNGTVDDPLDGFGPHFVASHEVDWAAVGAEVDDLAETAESPWSLL